MRRPDEISSKRDIAQTVNVDVVAQLSSYIGAFLLNIKVATQLYAATKPNGTIIYISTDYVFDGENPPYAEDAPTNAINEYGRQKVAGEQAALQATNGWSMLSTVYKKEDIQVLPSFCAYQFSMVPSSTWARVPSTKFALIC